MLRRNHRQVELFSGSILLRARFTGHWGVPCTRFTDHSHSRRENLHLDTSTGKARGENRRGRDNGNSGNDSRDRKMHKEVLESGQYADIVFRPDE